MAGMFPGMRERPGDGRTSWGELRGQADGLWRPPAGVSDGGALAAEARRRLMRLTLPELQALLLTGGGRRLGRDGIWPAIVALEARARAGELLQEMAERGERDRGAGGDRRSRSHCGTVKLQELGVTKNESSRWQRVARIPAELRDAYYRHAIGREPIRLAGLLRWAEARRGRGSRRRRAAEEALEDWRELERRLRHLLRTLPLAAPELAASPELRSRLERCRGLLQLVEAVLGRAPLSDLLDEGRLPPEQVQVPFRALFLGIPCGREEPWPSPEVEVLAVHLRTVVARPLGDAGDRRVLPMGEVLVDPAELRVLGPCRPPSEELPEHVPRCPVCGRGLADGAELPAYGPPCLECRAAAQRRIRQRALTTRALDGHSAA